MLRAGSRPTAAPNLVVGRRRQGRVLFDDGDEVLILNAAGLPERIVGGRTHAGTFSDCERPLSASAAATPARHLAERHRACTDRLRRRLPVRLL
jgi:hypothetical protein